MEPLQCRSTGPHLAVFGAAHAIAVGQRHALVGIPLRLRLADLLDVAVGIEDRPLCGTGTAADRQQQQPGKEACNNGGWMTWKHLCRYEMTLFGAVGKSITQRLPLEFSLMRSI